MLDKITACVILVVILCLVLGLMTIFESDRDGQEGTRRK